MTTAFSLAESRLNAAVMSRLTNASVILDGGDSIAALFDHAYVPVEIGYTSMASARPVITVLTSLVPSSPIGLTAAVTTSTGTTAYIIASHEPDGSGISMLALEQV